MMKIFQKISLPMAVLLLALSQNALAQTWAVATPPSGVTAEMSGVGHNGSKFVAVGTDLKVISSTNGVTWTDDGAMASVTPGTVGALQVYWASFLNLWIASTNVDLATNVKVYTSPNGTTWTARSIGVSGSSANRMSDNGSLVIAGTGNSRILKSDNGTTWTTQDLTSVLGTNITVQEVLFANGQWVICGGGGKVATSTDGNNWTLRSTPVTLTLRGLAFGSGTWVAIGPSNTAIRSTDNGVTWSLATIGIAKSFNDITFFDNKFFAVGADGAIASSADGATWAVNSSNAGTGQFFNGVARGGSVIVATGGNASSTVLRFLALPPANDLCANAATLTAGVSCTPTNGTTLGAAPDSGPGVCINANSGGPANAVWYKFVATATAHTVTATSGPGFDAVIGALNSCGSTPRPTGGACTDGFGTGVTETMNLSGLTIGSTYFIQVHDYFGGSNGGYNFTICVSTPPPANDNCAGATILTPGIACTPTNGTAHAATPDSGPGVCTNISGGGSINAVWYRFVATATAHTVTVDGDANFDAVIGALNSCGGTRPTGGDCTDTYFSGGVETMNLTGLTVGNTYFIQVHDFDSRNSATSTFTICVSTPPVNDNCAGAIALTPSIFCSPTNGTAHGATTDIGAGICPIGGVPNAVWYKFVATATAHTVTVDGGANFDAVTGVFNTCGGTQPTGGGCTDVTLDDGIETMNLSGLTVGSTYFIQVHDFSGRNQSSSTFSICVTVPPQLNEFIIAIKTDNPGTSNGTSFTIPTTGSGYNYEVDWNGDGTFEQTGIMGNVTHNYGTAGTYNLRIRGTFPRIYFNNAGDRQKLLDINQWGTNAWTSMESAFYGCSNLNITATDIPNLSAVTNMFSMFRACTILNSPSNIGNWNTGSVTNMRDMFYDAYAFNQPIGNWNTGNVTNMIGMFSGCSSFNQAMPNFNTAAVTDMSYMFEDCSSFNQPLTNFNTAAVTNMSYMFRACSSFNQPLPNFNTAAVRDMRSMFSGCSSFNQALTNFNTAAVTNMSYMFNNATAFNQSLAAWGTQLNTAVDLTGFLDNCGMSVANYDATLTGFNQSTVTGRSMGAVGRQYCASVAARSSLVGAKGWTITGDVLVCNSTAEINVKGNNLSIPDGDTTPSTSDLTNFGAVAVSFIAVVRTFTIENTGTQPLLLTGLATQRVVVSGANASDFTVIDQPASPVAATNGTATFEVFFVPSAGGLRTATIIISNSDADESPYTFDIQGIGCGATLLPIRNNITSGTGVYGATVITADNQITNANIEYRATQSVTLLPGFKAEGTVFKAQIGVGCN